MLENIKKSINSVLYERVRSPLYGTIIISWVIWNWRIFYVTFFVSENIIHNKLEYIQTHLYDYKHLIWKPLSSTAIILLLVPFVANGAYWLDLKFKQWRINQKHKIELKQFLTKEQSFKLRELVRKQEIELNELLIEKDEKIKNLELELSEKNKEKKNINSNEVALNSKVKNYTEMQNLLANKLLTRHFQIIKKLIDTGAYGDLVLADGFDFFEANDYITKIEGHKYTLSLKGKEFSKAIVNQNYK